MKRLSTPLLLIITLVLSMIPILASAGNVEMTDEQNVKLARYQAMMRAMRNMDPDDYHDTNTNESIKNGLDKAGCGSVDIGNIVDQGFGGPKEIDIIITGDVINANNECN